MNPVLFDFTDPGAARGWRAIDDRVMGGVSHSRLVAAAEGHAVFEGQVSLERQGGFASVRSAAGALGRAGALACELELRGDGRRYKLNLVTDDGFDSLLYQAGFDTGAPGWQRVRLALADFQPSFRGRAVPGAPALDPARVRQVGLLIADRQAGPFALQLRRIALV